MKHWDPIPWKLVGSIHKCVWRLLLRGIPIQDASQFDLCVYTLTHGLLFAIGRIHRRCRPCHFINTLNFLEVPLSVLTTFTFI